MQPATAPAARLTISDRSGIGGLTVHDASGPVGHEHGDAWLLTQGTSSELALTFPVEELVEAHEHLHPQVQRHVVSAAATEVLDAGAAGGDLVAVGHTQGRLDHGVYFDGAGADTPLAFEAGDNSVDVTDLVRRLRLGVADYLKGGAGGRLR